MGIAGTGAQRDRIWSETYEAGKATEPVIEIDMAEEVWSSLSQSFTDWIHRPDLWRGLADCVVPMHFIAPVMTFALPGLSNNLRHVVRNGRFSIVPDVPHDFWSTDPDIWIETVESACAAF